MDKVDILIVGSGCSGLFAALHLPKDKKITIITKKDVPSSDSFLAQGGMCVLRDDNDYDNYFEDTMRAGHYKNDKTSVDIMIRSSREIANELIDLGVSFTKDENGELAYTKEGAHSTKRILFHKDITGKEITEKLWVEARKRDNIEIIEYTTMLDIISNDNCCYGAVVQCKDGSLKKIVADYTLLATGGVGGLFKHSTNFRHLTGDALLVALKHNIELKDIDYIQIHPTTLYSDNINERSFLISESVRGEGAKLYNKKGERFIDELKPRDILSKAIFEQMKKDKSEFVWEDMRPIPLSELDEHFPNILQYCMEHGYNVKKECIPVVPAQHYYMGGVKVNHESKSSMERLYVVGEAACNGVHGYNRLASNSLLESLVFAKRAAIDISNNYSVVTDYSAADTVNLDDYINYEEKIEENKKAILSAISEAKKNREQKEDNDVR